jgi:hypothetical protein
VTISRTTRALALLLSFTFARTALAQDATAKATQRAPAATPWLGAKDDGTSNQAVGPIERLPASAFPAPQVRGIYGGSLWLEHDLQGLQWPYYPKTGIGVSGDVWVDTAYEKLSPGEPLNGSTGNTTLTGSTQFLQQARLVLRATPTWSNGKYFVQGQAEFVASRVDTQSGIIWSADDVWVKAGKWNVFDVQVGRYEAWEVYHFGMGLDLYTFERQGATGGPYTPEIYGLTYAFYRPDTVGRAAVHLYPTDWLRFELGGEFGPDSIPGAGGSNTLSVRPVGVASFGWVRIKAGAEYRDLTGSQEGAKQEVTQRGIGGAIQFIADPYLEFGVNGAFGHQEQRSNDGTLSATGTFDIFSLGGFANVRVIDGLLVGGGLDYTRQEDTDFDPNVQRNDVFDHWQTFGAVQYLLLDHLFIKGVFAYALADLNPTPTRDPSIYKNEMLSGRLRLEYPF